MGNFHRNKYHISHELGRTQKLCFLDLVFFFLENCFITCRFVIFRFVLLKMKIKVSEKKFALIFKQILSFFVLLFEWKEKIMRSW